MAQDINPDWDAASVSLGENGFEHLESVLSDHGMLPLIEEHRQLVITALTTGSRATMRWMAKLAKAGIPISDADDIPEAHECSIAGILGECDACHAKFPDGAEVHVWEIQGKTLHICATCDAAKKADVLKRKGKQ